MNSKRFEYLQACEDLALAEAYAKRFPSVSSLTMVIVLRKRALALYEALPRHHQLDPAPKPGMGMGNGPLLVPPGKVEYKPPKKVDRKLRNRSSNWVMSFRGRDN